jgi:hypothetical protein
VKLVGELDPEVTRASLLAAAVYAHHRSEKQAASVAAPKASSGGASWRNAGRRGLGWKRG